MNYAAHSSASFRRSIHYILNPPERVGVVQSLNLATENFAREMEVSIAAARAIQARNRTDTEKRKSHSGADAKAPAFHFSLAWHPSEEPTDAHVLETAQAALKHLGLERHQAIVARHHDKPHAHIHVVVSRLNPETGRMASLRLDRVKMNEFCHSYEKQHVIVSKNRASRMNPNRPKLSRAAERARLQIKALTEKSETQIKTKHANNAARRKDEKDTSWKTYQQQRKDIKRKYDRQISEIWSRDDATPKHDLEPRPGDALFPQKPEWMQHSELLRKTGNLPPPGHPPPSIDRDSMRRQLTEGLERKMHQELGKLAMLHERREKHLKANHQEEIEAQKLEWSSFKNQSKALWQNWRTTFIKKDMDVEPLKPEFNKNRKVDKSPEITVSGFADDYISGKGRDSVEHQQFAANNAEEIEAEFARRYQKAEAEDLPRSEIRRTGKPKQQYRVNISDGDAIAQFSDFLRRDMGFDLRLPIIADGGWHRSPVQGQRTAGKKSGTYCLHLDQPVTGMAINWKTGLRRDKDNPWRPNGEYVPMTSAEIQRAARETEQRTARAAAQLQSEQNDAATFARMVWNASVPASTKNDYLQKKDIGPHGVRECREHISMPSRDPDKPNIDLKGALICPRYKNGELRSFQAIFPDGRKQFQTHGETKGTGWIIGNFDPKGALVISESFSTGSTVNEATNLPVGIAYSAGSLKEFAVAVRKQFPDLNIIFAADNDRNLETQGKENTGIVKATEAAEAVHGSVVAPDFGPHNTTDSDWNDFGQRFGLQSVADFFPSVEPAHEPDLSMGLER